MLGHVMDGVLEFTVGEGAELIEEREDEARREIAEEEGEEGNRDPAVEPGEIEGAEEIEDEGEEGEPDRGGKDEALALVDDERGARGFVEAKVLLDDEGIVELEGKKEEVMSEVEDADEGDAGGDRPKRPGTDELVEPFVSAEKPEKEEDDEGNGAFEKTEAGGDARVFLGAGVFFLVEGVGKLGGELWVERGEVEEVGDEIEKVETGNGEENDVEVGVGVGGHGVVEGCVGDGRGRWM